MSELEQRGVAVLTSIPGIARVTASGLLTEMPELGHLDAKAAASLAGVAPITRESGQWKGRSFIHGGRARVRRMLYHGGAQREPAQSGSGAKYQELTTRGKPPKVALTAVMRKLVVLANTLLAQDRRGRPTARRRRREPRSGRPPSTPDRTTGAARSGAASRHRASVQTATPEKRADPRFEVVLILWTARGPE